MIAIFDWDGTLCDSVDGIVAAMQAAALELSLAPPSAPQIRDIVGLGLPEAILKLFPALEEVPRATLAAAYSRQFAAPERGPVRLFDGAVETLEALRSRGIELAVATGKSRRGLDRVLGSLGLASFFDATRCADETRSKPDPQMLLEIMASRDKSPHQVLMIGDSAYDLAMAQQAGVSSVAVSFGVHDRATLAAYNPLAVVDSLPELLELSQFAG